MNIVWLWVYILESVMSIVQNNNMKYSKDVITLIKILFHICNTMQYSISMQKFLYV